MFKINHVTVRCIVGMLMRIDILAVVVFYLHG